MKYISFTNVCIILNVGGQGPREKDESGEGGREDGEEARERLGD